MHREECKIILAPSREYMYTCPSPDLYLLLLRPVSEIECTKRQYPSGVEASSAGFKQDNGAVLSAEKM